MDMFVVTAFMWFRLETDPMNRVTTNPDESGHYEPGDRLGGSLALPARQISCDKAIVPYQERLSPDEDSPRATTTRRYQGVSIMSTI